MVLPAANLGNCRELMLTQDVCCEAVCICPSLALGVGQNIDLAVSLFEGLDHAILLQNLPCRAAAGYLV